MEKKFLEGFMRKNFNKKIVNSIALKRRLREKVINYMSNGKATIILLTVGSIKKTLL